MTTDCSLDLHEKYQLRTSGEHVVYKNCFLFLFWHSKQFLYTTCSPDVLSLYFLCKFSEQSVVILWVSRGENKSFWQLFTCTMCCHLTGLWTYWNRLKHIQSNVNGFLMGFEVGEIFRVSPVFGLSFYFPVNIYSCKQRNKCNQTVPTKRSQDLPRPFFYNSTDLTKKVSCHSVYE